MNRLQVRQLVIVGVDAHAKEEPSIPPVNNLERSELNEVGLVLLVPGRDKSVDLSL